MKRRDFLKTGSVAALGSLLLNPFSAKANTIKEEFRGKKAKNIIFMVSDGMSTGTLVMADLYLKRKFGRSSNWMGLYQNKLSQRGVMDMASANSIVTDSSAASSSWGGGVRVNNGSLNISPDGKKNMPILQKFKKAGKKVGCITTIHVNHATPAGFSVCINKRGETDEIAEMHSELEFDVLMGGGMKNFDAERRKDKKDLYSTFLKKGYTVAKTKAEMNAAPKNKPLLGTFDVDALPYTIDQLHDSDLKEKVPTLAEMTQKAIDQMKDHPQGFVMQVEGGKVDWAAHANDVSALLYDQVAFDDAIKVAIDFAKKDGNTLVVITTDHGNSNPGIMYGEKSNENFDHLQNFKHSNDAILQSIKPTDSVAKVQSIIEENCAGMKITDDEAKEILSYYNEAKKENGLYNYKHLPYRVLAEMQKRHTSVSWISMNHSADYVELAMFGPGSGLMTPFMINTDMHGLLLRVAEIEDKF